MLKDKKYKTSKTLGEGAVRELIDEVVREQIRTQARELEKHLQSIHSRLVELEKKP